MPMKVRVSQPLNALILSVRFTSRSVNVTASPEVSLR